MIERYVNDEFNASDRDFSSGKAKNKHLKEE